MDNLHHRGNIGTYSLVLPRYNIIAGHNYKSSNIYHDYKDF